jgi:hypothetical protein
LIVLQTKLYQRIFLLVFQPASLLIVLQHSITWLLACPFGPLSFLLAFLIYSTTSFFVAFCHIISKYSIVVTTCDLL